MKVFKKKLHILKKKQNFIVFSNNNFFNSSILEINVVTEHFISSSRFDLEFKVNMKFPTNWQVSIISKAALSIK